MIGQASILGAGSELEVSPNITPSRSDKVSDGPWSVILAGGEGDRIKPFILRWLKRHKPKQYCTFVGTRSMLEHTLARADLLSPRARQLTVIRRSHLPEARPQFAGRSLKTLILQPENCDTGPGVFLPLTYIRAKDFDATVVFYPSDHFVCPEDEFSHVVAGAAMAADRMPDRFVLLGAFPDGAESDYGWIGPGETLDRVSGQEVRSVRSFHEKPGRSRAEALMASRGLWNTMIFAVKQTTLWSMGLRYLPDMMPLFERLGDAIGGPQERALLKEIYQAMPSRNFSSGLLALAAEKAAVIELPESILWSDWGRPERIAATIHRINKPPAFPWGCLKPEYQT